MSLGQQVTVKLSRSHNGVGIHVDDFALDTVPDPEQVVYLKHVLSQEGVLIFRGQRRLTVEQQLAFTRAFDSSDEVLDGKFPKLSFGENIKASRQPSSVATGRHIGGTPDTELG